VASLPGALRAPTAHRLLTAAHEGSREFLGVLDGASLLVVELDPDDDLDVPVPPWLPAVVVAVADAPPSRPAPAGVDIALCPTGAGAPPAGWVALADPAGEAARLGGTAARFPQSAVVLAQLLRTTLQGEEEQAFLAESLAYSTLQAGPAFAAWLAERRGAPQRERPEPEHAVVVERRDDRLLVTLHRPHVHNAVNGRMREELAEALMLACADHSVRAVELRGEGPSFSSGGDLDEFGTLPDPATGHLVRMARSPARLLARMRSRTVVYVHGACVGAGIELAAFAATVVAAPDTRVQLPEVPLGLVPGSGGTVSIPRRVGRHRAAWLAIGAATIDAVTAAQWGLVDRIED